MKRILICWLGMTDIRAATEPEEVGRGPIGQAVDHEEFSQVYMLVNYPEELAAPYVEWLRPQTKAKIKLYPITLTTPTNFGEIYQAARNLILEVKKANPKTELVFHLSPGTPAMAAVWVILAKTRFPAELIESAKDRGVRTASVPFDISAEFIPDLLDRPDREIERLAAAPPPESPEFSNIIHRSTIMKRMVARAQKVAPRSISVLIEGESGTGKELLARAIHRASPRKDKPFITVNCGAIPPELVESELFGHEKGAFSGAISQRKGYFEAGDEGTVFLDEIGELPLKAQVKLLRAIQEGEIVRVGSTSPIKIDIRIISATNRTLTDEIAQGDFREDLFYRLAVAVIQIPPLRERHGDLSLLIEKLLDQVNHESAQEPGYEHKKISTGAKNLLLQHVWPGNVRELLNTLRRLAVWSSGDSIRVEDVRDSLFPVAKAHGNSDAVLNRDLSDGIDLQALIDEVAQHYLERALDRTHGNKTKAAQLLGIANYQTLTNWMKKHGVKT